MAKVGSYGKKKDRIESSFDWFVGCDCGDCDGQGMEVRVNPRFTDLLITDQMAKVAHLDAAEPAAFEAMRNMVSMFVHTDDFERFWTIAIQHGQSTEDLMDLYQDVMEKIADRPTGQPSDSSSGRLTTDPNSSDASLSQAVEPYGGQSAIQAGILRLDAERQRRASA